MSVESVPLPPTSTPELRAISPLLPADSSWQFDHTSSGARRSHSIHPPSTSPADAQGQSTVNSVSSGIGCAVNVNDVTTPKLPPPPPRDAQYRSG